MNRFSLSLSSFFLFIFYLLFLFIYLFFCLLLFFLPLLLSFFISPYLLCYSFYLLLVLMTSLSHPPVVMEFFVEYLKCLTVGLRAVACPTHRATTHSRTKGRLRTPFQQISLPRVLTRPGDGSTHFWWSPLGSLGNLLSRTSLSMAWYWLGEVEKSSYFFTSGS